MSVKKFYTQEDPLLVYKWVTNEGKAPWGRGTWDLPKNGKPGAIQSIGDLAPVMCQRGIHGYQDLYSMLGHMSSDRLFVAQLWGKVVCWEQEKVAAQSGRLLYEMYLNSDPTGWTYDSVAKLKEAFWRDYRRHGPRQGAVELCKALHIRLMNIQANQPPSTLVESLTRK